MPELKSRDWMRNLLAVVLLATMTAFAAFYEGFFPLISIPFLLVLVGGFGIALWLSLGIMPRRLLALIVCIFVIEYIKEAIGIIYGFWTYHGRPDMFVFGVLSWEMGGLAAYTISTRLVIPVIKRININLPRWLSPLFLLLLFIYAILSLGPYRAGAGSGFYIFYILLLLLALRSAYGAGAVIFIGFVLSAWLVGNLSEFMGSIMSGIWTYPHDSAYPPLFLVIGLWPVDILAQYGLSAYLAGDSQTGYS